MEGKDRQKKNKDQGGEKSLSSSFLPFYLLEKNSVLEGGREKKERGRRGRVEWRKGE